MYAERSEVTLAILQAFTLSDTNLIPRTVRGPRAFATNSGSAITVKDLNHRLSDAAIRELKLGAVVAWHYARFTDALQTIDGLNLDDPRPTRDKVP